MKKILLAPILTLALTLTPAINAHADSITVGDVAIPFSVPHGYLRGEGDQYATTLAAIRASSPGLEVHALYVTAEADKAYRKNPEAGLTQYIVIMTSRDLHDSGFSAKGFAELVTLARETPEAFLGTPGGTVLEDSSAYTPPDPAAPLPRIVRPASVAENQLYVTYLFPLKAPAAANEELVCVASLVRTKGKLVTVYQYERGTLPETIRKVRTYAPNVIAAMGFPENEPETPAADAPSPATPSAGENGPVTGEALPPATPTGYVLADEETYGPFLASISETMEAEGMTVRAMYVPRDIDAAVRKDPDTPVDKYLLVMAADAFDTKTFSKREFREMQDLYREYPDLAASETAPGTADEPRRIGPPIMTETSVFYGVQTQNEDGDGVLGAMSLTLSGTELVYAYLYAMPEHEGDIDALLKDELPRLVAELRLPPPLERDGKPFILAGFGVLCLAFVLGMVFILREKTAP